MGFWDTMQRGAAVGVEVHGEEVTVAERVLIGVVDPVTVETSLTHGGDREVVGLSILFTLEDGLLGICFLRGVPEDVVVEIGVPVEALAKTGEGEKGGVIHRQADERKSPQNTPELPPS